MKSTSRLRSQPRPQPLPFLLLLLLAGSGSGLETNVDYSQTWRSYQVEEYPGATATDRGLSLGWGQRFSGALLHSATNIGWYDREAVLQSGWVALDSVRLGRARLGITAGDNAMAATGPTADAAASCRGVGTRLRLGDDSLHVVAGRVPDSVDYWTFKQNQYLVGMEGTYSSHSVLAGPYLVYRADNDTGYSGLAAGVETQIGIGSRMRMNARAALSSYEHRSAHPTAAAGKLGCTYSYGRLASWGEFGAVGSGYLAPDATLHENDRCDLSLGTRYSLGALALTGAGSRYWSERARENGTQVGTALSLGLSKLLTATLDAGYRTGRDTTCETRTLAAKAGVHNDRWGLAASAEHAESLAPSISGRNTYQAELGLSSWRYLTGQVEAGISTGLQPLTDFARVSATSDPSDWLQLQAGADISRTQSDPDTTNTQSGQCGVTLKPVPFASLSNRFDITATKSATGTNSATGFTTYELRVKPINWLALIGLLGTGWYESADSTGSLFRAGATVGISVNKAVQAEITAERQTHGSVKNDRVSLKLTQSGDPTRLGLVWVRGRVFLDRDQTRTYSPGDEPLPSVRVMLNDSLAMTTNRAGEFWFPAPLGRFTVSYDPTTLPAYIGSQGTRRQVKVGFLGTVKVDFPIYELGEITGAVYQDTNRNGIREPDEPGLPNVVVLLEDSYDRATATDADGRYLLANLDPQSYQISLRNLPPDFEATTPAVQTIKVAPAHRVIVDFGLAPKPRPTIRKVFPPQ